MIGPHYAFSVSYRNAASVGSMLMTILDNLVA